MNMKNIEKIYLQNEYIKLTLLDVGATIYTLETKDKNNKFENIVLSYADEKVYYKNPIMLGTTLGRVGGRISNAKFELNNKVYKLKKNFKNKHSIHGGDNSVSTKKWKYNKLSNEEVHFNITQKSIDDDFPGDVNISVIYKLENNKLRIEYNAISTEDTILNMTNHSYFNLSGDLKDSVKNDIVYISSNIVIKGDDDNIPIGKFDIQENSIFDFNKPKSLKPILENKEFINFSQGGIDHTFMLTKKEMTIYNPLSKRFMSITTDYPAVVVYTTNYPDTENKLINGNNMQRFDGICFECQYEPNGINNKNFNSAILKKGEKYNHFIEYKFDNK